MPYVNDRVCFICGFINTDRDDMETMVQIVAPDGNTVNCCKKHRGVISEADDQEQPYNKKKYAMRVYCSEKFQREVYEIQKKMDSDMKE